MTKKYYNIVNEFIKRNTDDKILNKIAFIDDIQLLPTRIYLLI